MHSELTSFESLRTNGENYPENAKSRIMRYKDTILRPLEVMAPITHIWIHTIIETNSSYTYAWCV